METSAVPTSPDRGGSCLPLHTRPQASTRLSTTTPPPRPAVHPPAGYCPLRMLKAACCPLFSHMSPSRMRCRGGGPGGAGRGVCSPAYVHREGVPAHAFLEPQPQGHGVELPDLLALRVPRPLPESAGGVRVPSGPRRHLVHLQRFGSPDPRSALLAIWGTHPEDRKWVTLAPRPTSRVSLACCRQPAGNGGLDGVTPEDDVLVGRADSAQVHTLCQSCRSGRRDGRGRACGTVGGVSPFGGAGRAPEPDPPESGGTRVTLP